MDDMGGDLKCGVLSGASIYFDEFRWEEDDARIYGECPDGFYEEFCLPTAKHMFRCCDRFTVTVSSPRSAVIGYDDATRVSNFRSTVMNEYQYRWDDELPSTCNAKSPARCRHRSKAPVAPENHKLFVVEVCYDDQSANSHQPSDQARLLKFL
jgi:hypothetical protein